MRYINSYTFGKIFLSYFYPEIIVYLIKNIMNSKDPINSKGRYVKLSVHQQLAIKGGRAPGDDKPKRPKILRPSR